MSNTRPTLALAFCLTGYVVVAVALVWGMTVVRQSALAQLSTAAAQAAWEEWRVEAAKQDGSRGPVQRTAPKTAEPPVLVMMRDHFVVCVLALLLPATGLYVFVAWAVWGVLRQSHESARHQVAER